MQNIMILERTVIAPTAISPFAACKEELKHTVITLSVACMMKGEIPKSRQGTTIFLRSRKFFHFNRKSECLLARNATTNTQEAA